MTGTSTSPATIEGSAPSMPATATIARAERRVSVCASSRCTPATPTSNSRVTRQPMTSAQTAASSATGMSAVPPVATTTWPSRGRCSRRSTTMTRAVSMPRGVGGDLSHRGELLRRRARGEQHVAVRRAARQRSPRPARAVLPWQKTTSGKPLRSVAMVIDARRGRAAPASRRTARRRGATRVAARPRRGRVLLRTRRRAGR